MKEFTRHYEKVTQIAANAAEIFDFSDNHSNFSSHMSESSWMMGGGKMQTNTVEGNGEKVGSHIRMKGSVLGIKLYLDEVITEHIPPNRKTWQTKGDLNLLVIDHYKMGFEINPDNGKSLFKVYIDYNLPQSIKTRLLGILFGKMYAKWCVEQMVNNVQKHFERIDR